VSWPRCASSPFTSPIPYRRDHPPAGIFNCPTSSNAMLLCSVQGWHTAVKPVFEVVSLERKALGASVPLPKTVIRYILSAVLPRVLQRKLLGLLPQELGQYMLDSGQAGRLAGHFLPAWQLISWKIRHARHASARISCPQRTPKLVLMPHALQR